MRTLVVSYDTECLTKKELVYDNDVFMIHNH